MARIKREVSVERLAEARGVKLSRHGADLLGLCPFHDDKEPSLVITPKKNLWHCLGACQAGGSVIDWVMRDRGVSFRHAVELLRSDLPSAAVVEAKGSEPVLPAPVEVDAEDEEVLRQVVGFYHETLQESPEALSYLESRGLAHRELIERFQLGFANRTLGYRLPDKKVKAGREMRGRLQRLGVLRPSGHEHFNGSLVIPVFDGPPEQGGRVVEIYGRKIGERLRKGTPLHLYLPGPHRGVFNLPALAASTEIILCESLIDALTFWCAGYRNVTSSYGINGFTDEMLAAFVGHGIERVLIAYDRDAAGEAAAGKLAERLLAVGIECYRVLFPRGMDANEYAVKTTPASKSLGLVLRKAEWMGQGEVPATEATAKEEESEELFPLAAGRVEVPSPETREDRGEREALALPEPAAASPLPPPPPEIPTEVREQEVVMELGDRRYRVRGLQKNLAYDVLKINLLAGRGEAFHVDTLDLYSARQRTVFQKAAAGELGVEEAVVKTDLGKVLGKLEALQDEQIRAALEPQPEAVELSEAERAEALELLGAPDLLARILEDFERCGVVGEETNKLMGYLASTSRLLERPLAVVVQSSSSAGKSSLMEAILALMPAEHQVKYSAMTGQSLFYMGETNLSHKILAIVEEEGAERASYALKLLQSEGELTIASTGKDPSSGRLVTHEYRVEGPVMIFLTTTAIDIDEELLNRCLVLSVDEAREQTRAIHRLQRQRRTLEGLKAGKRREAILALHRNAQRLLRPLAVVNPYAPELTFLDTQIRTRRDHEKYLTLIDSIALLHQHQRKIQRARVDGREVEYVEVELSDIETANRLAHEVLGRSLDELPPQTRRLLEKIEALVSSECERLEMERSHFRFTRREVREATGWGNTQLKVHLRRLEELEYLLVHQGGRGQSFVYELQYEAADGGGQPWLPGLIEVERLGTFGSDSTFQAASAGRFGSESTFRSTSAETFGSDSTLDAPSSRKRGYDAKKSGQTEKKSGPSRPQVGGVSGGGRGDAVSMESETCAENGLHGPKNAHQGVGEKDASYRSSRPTGLALELERS
ncbi:MAG: CHC2 zinc finger domain-containing protein [Acidobacteriota bacterium]|nr:CHC2 zinc finger domain-containing protein [Acidobacteriota bacterium]